MKVRQVSLSFFMLAVCLVVGIFSTGIAQAVEIEWWTFPAWWSGITGEETEAELEALKDAGKPATWFEYMADKFMQEYPEVTIEHTIIPWGEEQKVDIALMTGTGADVFYVYPALLGKYRAMGLLEPIDDYLAETNVEDFFEPALGFAYYEDNHYLWPWVYGTEGEWIVNKSIFEERNATDLLPQPPDYAWTIDQMIEAAKATTFTRDDGTEVYGLGIGINAPTGINIWPTWSLIMAYGGELWDVEKGGVTSEARDRIQKALQLLVDLDRKHGVVPPGLEGQQSAGIGDLWNRKQIAINIGGGLGVIRGVRVGLASGTIEPPFEPMMVLPPIEPGNPLAVKGAVGGFVINAQASTERKHWAQIFARWLTDTEQIKTIKFMLPTRKSAAAMAVEGDPLQEWLVEHSMPHLVPNPISEHLNEISDIWMETMQATVAGRFTPEQGADDYAKRVNRILEFKE